MDRPTYLTKLASIEQELPKLANTLNAMKITDTVSYGKSTRNSVWMLHSEQKNHLFLAKSYLCSKPGVQTDAS